MKPSYEKLMPASGQSFRCFDRSRLRSPVKWHRHPEIELTYIPCGSGSRIVGDHIDSYTDHDLVLCGSQLPHTWASDEYRGKQYDRHRALVTQFHPDFLGTEFFGTDEMRDIACLLQRADRGLWFPTPMAIEIGRQIESLMHCTGAERLIGLLKILDGLSRCKDAVSLTSELYCVTQRAAASDATESRIQSICDHIASHLSDPDLSQRELAELADMNASAFSRFFKQSTGRTPSAYIGELRIGLSCRLLTDTDDSVLSICHQSGFANLSNFNRRFRQLRGMTPRDYRTRFRTTFDSSERQGRKRKQPA
ncbi:HTH-type transcriptional activator Btr [Stieleria maiorica]|uniref:HTH-type transcriptional activator Btr n=1 Tax=Stieleria maiorica TaxID=2795974 RepID=A0A5B9MQA2_9BACT|nr:AraC family transcriptional regulator [Stieleria maiorica]QEG02580.1 HTH-type transcriptional activator Btr [Stieleria maiorica]